MIECLSSLVSLPLIAKIWGKFFLERNSWVSGFHLFFNFLFPLYFKAVTSADPTGFFCSSSDPMVGGQWEIFRRLGTSFACIGLEEVCSLGEESPEEIKGSGPGKREAEVEIDLDDEPESLLGSLDA